MNEKKIEEQDFSICEYTLSKSSGIGEIIKCFDFIQETVNECKNIIKEYENLFSIALSEEKVKFIEVNTCRDGYFWLDFLVNKEILNELFKKSSEPFIMRIMKLGIDGKQIRFIKSDAFKISLILPPEEFKELIR